jgi:hypothetical protein
MPKIKAVHIHTDKKFISETRKFEGAFFENEIILITKSKEDRCNYKTNVTTISTSLLDIYNAIRLCKKAQIVVLYDFDPIKQKIALALPNSIVIFWRFFGYELHNLNREYSYTEHTKLLLDKENKKRNQVLFTINRILSIAKWRLIVKSDLDLSIKRINFFLAWSEEEYAFLERYKKKLPTLIKLPLRLNIGENVEEYLSKKNASIIIGNNRSSANNHIDILNIITKVDSNDFLYIIPLNYGYEISYSNKVKDKVAELPNVLVLNDFMPLNEYNELFQNSSALVINTLHQGALGNIFMAIENHTKIYLNKINPVYIWLKNIGFSVFTIEEFESDLRTNNIKLVKGEAINNILANEKELNTYSVSDFQIKIFRLLERADFS